MTLPDDPVVPRRTGRARVRPARRPLATHPRADKTLAIIAALVIGFAFLAYDVAGLADLNREPITGVDYVPVVEFLAERKQPGEKVLVALPPPAFMALDSTEDLIFLSSPIDRKRAQRYTRLTEDGNYVDYWTGVDSVVDTAGLCQTLLTEPGIWLVVDESRLNADWAFRGSMATVIRGMTYVRYEVDGGAQLRRLAPVASRTARAEELCAQAQTGEVLGAGPIEDVIEGGDDGSAPPVENDAAPPGQEP
ncbi:MAG: hypothetical protein M3Y37_04065 [Chloroflexota bacterium]|nr:hypothetical protein [Chloroflexota bacterium]